MVHARKTVAKNGIATHHCSFQYIGLCTNKLYGYFHTSTSLMWKYLASFTNIPCLVVTVNHATKNETAKIMVTPYLTGTSCNRVNCNPYCCGNCAFNEC